MVKTFEVIKIDNYGVVVDTENYARMGSYVTNGKEIAKVTYFDTVTLEYQIGVGNSKRVSATVWNLIIYSISKRFEGVTLIELPDKANTYATNVLKNGLTIDGIKQEYSLPQMAQIHALIYFAYKANINMYSEEDMLKAIEMARIVEGSMSVVIKQMTYENYDSSDFLHTEYEIIQSLQKQSIPIEVTLEMEQEELGSVYNGRSSNKMWSDPKVKIHNKETNTITAVNYK